MIAALRLACIILMFMGLPSCERAPQRSSEVTRKVRPDDRETFIMAALRSGALFAYSPAVDENVLTTRYSDQVATAIRPLLLNLPPTCTFVGLTGTLEGNLMHSGTEKPLRLSIDHISDVRPLHEWERRQLQNSSPTMSRETIC